MLAVYLGLLIWLSGTAQANPHDGGDTTLNRALGVDCAYCHSTDNPTDPSQPKRVIAERMLTMVRQLNAGPLRDTDGVSCWTCHQGQTRPARLPRSSWESQQFTHFTGALATTAEAVQLSMSVYNASLGVGCDFCHEPGSWASRAKAGHATARRMGEMMNTLPPFMPASARTQCYMCHKGSTTPERRPARRP